MACNDLTVDNGDFSALLQEPPQKGSAGFETFVQQVAASSNTDDWTSWDRNTDCLEILVNEHVRSVTYYYSDCTRVDPGNPHNCTGLGQTDYEAFWTAYPGRRMAMRDRLALLHPFWAYLMDCDPPQLRTASVPCVNIGSADMNIAGHFVIKERSSCDTVPNPFKVNEGNAINLAIELIRSNYDIVDWLACALDRSISKVAPNRMGLQACLDAYWNNFASSDRRTIVFDIGRHLFPAQNEAYTLEEGAGCRVRIQVTDLCDTYLRGFPALDSSSKKCVIAHVAAFLLHESVHCCAFETRQRDRTTLFDAGGTCANAYMLANAFRWALSKRYPTIASAVQCGYFTHMCTFFSDHYAGPGVDPCWS